ncbi:MAG: hypothetical protein WC307_04770 [Candidatus Nanoarchaeia archaeon]|jgi:hypothetical protein
MEEYGIYVGQKLAKRSPKSGVPLWRWTLVKRVTKKPTSNEIKEEINAKKGNKGYAMRLKPRPWKKVSETISV